MSRTESEWRLGPFRKALKTEEIVFGQVREDYSYEARFSDGDVLCVASGGDLALEALAQGARKVVAVDVNFAQICLVELKVAAIRLKKYSEVLEMFTGDARPGYLALRSSLSPECRLFFDSRSHVLSSGLQNSGLADRVIHRLSALFRRLFKSHAEMERFLSFEDLALQQEFFYRRWNDWGWRFAFRAAFNPFALRQVLGRSFSEAIPKDFARDFKVGCDTVFLTFCNAHNPFVWQALAGTYPAAGFPTWLQEDGWIQLQGRLDRLSLRTGDLLDELINAKSPFQAICLTNILDVSPAGYQDRLVETLLSKCPAGGHVISRSFFPAPHLYSRSKSGGFKVVTDVEFEDRSFFCRHREHVIKT